MAHRMTAPFARVSRALSGNPTGDEGWFFGHLLDGIGGSTPLTPWDAATLRHARRGDGAWVHLDYRAPRAKEFIAACAGGRWTAFKDLEVKKQTHISNLMVADPRKTQPRCEITFSENAVCTGMLLSLEVNFGNRFEANEPLELHRNIVPLRMWLGRGILITARGHQPQEGTLRLPSLSQSLEDGSGPETCGALASTVISEVTSVTADSALRIEDEMFELQARLQQQARLAGAHRPVAAAALHELRQELMPLRYAAICMRRYEVPELNALGTVVRLSERPEQRLFDDADKYELREAMSRQDALVESLNATLAAGEALQKEIEAHATWEQSVYSFRLTVLGSVLSVLGFCSISIDALSLMTEWGWVKVVIKSFVG